MSEQISAEVLAETDGARVERLGGVVHVVLDAPERRNAQTPATWRFLSAVPDLLEPTDRAVILRASGPSFSAGLDTRMFTPEGIPGEESILSIAIRPADEIDAFIQQAQAAFTWWASVPQVTIACVQGHAIGAGFQLALACDLRVVSDDVRFAMRETTWGLVPDLAGTGPLVAAVGYGRALEICASGRFVEADEAMATGLAHRVAAADALLPTAHALLEPILAADLEAVSELKRLLQGADRSADQPARERAAQVRRLQALATPARTAP